LLLDFLKKQEYYCLDFKKQTVGRPVLMRKHLPAEILKSPRKRGAAK
jgi:hypothetical protein